jgi:hypothetical protein
VARERGTDATQGIVAETWLSANGHAEISSFTSPYPGNIRQHISVDSNAGYPIDFYVYGLIASGSPQVAYTGPVTDNWNKPIRQVISRGEADQPMQVSALGSPARVQVSQVQFDSVWSGRTSAILDRIPEISVDVR